MHSGQLVVARGSTVQRPRLHMDLPMREPVDPVPSGINRDSDLIRVLFPLQHQRPWKMANTCFLLKACHSRSLVHCRVPACHLGSLGRCSWAKAAVILVLNMFPSMGITLLEGQGRLSRLQMWHWRPTAPDMF